MGGKKGGREGAPRRLYTATTNLEDPETELCRLRDV